MAKEKEFLEKLMSDEKLRAEVEAAEPQEIVRIASEAGFDIDASELEKGRHGDGSFVLRKKNSISIIDNIKSKRGWGNICRDHHEKTETGCKGRLKVQTLCVLSYGKPFTSTP